MVPPHGRWLRQQEVTQHIHPTKQGYRVISVPATGLFWSTIWSTLVGASARPEYGNPIPPLAHTPPGTCPPLLLTRLLTNMRRIVVN